MQKKLHKGLALALLVAVGVGAYLYFTGYRGPRVSLQNARKTRAGMTEREVERIMGAPDESEQIDVPDAAQLMGNMFGVLGGLVSGQPSKENVATKTATVWKWNDGEKKIIALFINHVVLKSVTEGLGEEANQPERVGQMAAGKSASAKPADPKKDEKPFFAFRSLAVMPIKPPDVSN